MLGWFPGIVNETVSSYQNNGWKNLVKTLTPVLSQPLPVLQPHSLALSSWFGMKLTEATYRQKQLWSGMSPPLFPEWIEQDHQQTCSSEILGNLTVRKDHKKCGPTITYISIPAKWNTWIEIDTSWGLLWYACDVHIYEKNNNDLEDEQFEDIQEWNR